MSGETQQRTVFVGRFTHGVDDKRRVSIPAKWRAAVSSSEEFCVISDPRDHQLIVFPQVVLNKMLEKADEITLGEFERRDALRALTSHGHTSSFDAHGRIMLTGDLLQQAEITKEAVLVGVFNKFEIWAPHRIVEVEHATAEKATDGAKALGI